MQNPTRLRWIFLVTVICLEGICLPLNIMAQDKTKNKTVTVNGQVVNQTGASLSNVLVDLKESLTFTLTDADGNFTISVPGDNAELVFNLEGYSPLLVKVGKERELKIMLTPKVKTYEDKEIYLMYSKQKKSKITSAVATIEGKDIENAPVMFLNAAISGKMMGLLTIQESGLPGSDDASVYLRGRRSWQNRNPLVFVDGHRRPMSLIDFHEIDQISAYKDAGSLAVLALRGGNGAIMATTKRGKEGRPLLKFNAQLSIQEPTKTYDFLDSWHFAKLYNEAQVNDGVRETDYRYTDEDFQKYLTHESPYTHPDVDWMDEMLKESTVSQKYNMSIEGGSSLAKYYVNLAYMNNDGLYKTDNLNSYNTNANFQMYSIRSNVDVALTRDMSLGVNLYGRQQKRQNPGGSSTDILYTLYSLPSNKFPVNYGPDMVAGTNEFRKNPYGILNHGGYTQYIHNTVETSAEVKQKLDFMTKGLLIRGSIAFDARYDNTINRSKTYVVHQYMGEDPLTGEDTFKQWGEASKQNNSNSFGSRKIRIFDLEAGVDYVRTFGKHDVAASLVVIRNEESDDTEQLTNIHQGVFGRATYVYSSRYIGEFSLGYQGTEQLPPDKRYGFFPAGSIGWIISEEPFIKEHLGNVISFFKLRGSYGLAGNDDGIPYYYYLPTFKLNSSARYNFGTTGKDVPGWIENGLFNGRVTWEESLKLNVGADIRLFKDQFSLGFNIFNEKTNQILTTRGSVSALLGLGSGVVPLANVGKTRNRGFEIETSFTNRIHDFNWTIGGNFSYAHNKILFNDEQSFEYNYRYTVGNPINSQYGLISNGLYKDEQDMLNSPATNFGPAYAGDIKYRDLNGDGIIDLQDQAKIGESNLGDVSYGFSLGVEYKGFDFKALFTGVAERNYYVRGIGIIAFTNISGTGSPFDGNVQQYHWDNRYNPQDPATWATATYPRLSLQGRVHNTQTSSFWIEDGSFIRLKNLEFGYSLPQKWTKNFWISKVRVFYSGYNLFTWDKMRTVDPESNPDANNYPVQRISSIGINIQF
jgi:TonB-linked SusC/RagA family outer membrane protein